MSRPVVPTAPSTKTRYIFLPEGEHANVISFTPPLTITESQLAEAVEALAEVLTTDAHG